VIYLYDGWQCIEEREDDGGTWEARRQYVYGGIYIDEPLIFDKDYDSDGDCTDFNYGGSRGAHRYYYAQQVNYNVTAMVVDDGDGSVTFIEWAEYDPYGAATVTIADGQSATGNPYLFQGRRWDAEIGLYYFRNRWYSPELGRFLQRRYPDSHLMRKGPYALTVGNPLAERDPLGLPDWFGGVDPLGEIERRARGALREAEETIRDVVNPNPFDIFPDEGWDKMPTELPPPNRTEQLGEAAMAQAEEAIEKVAEAVQAIKDQYKCAHRVKERHKETKRPEGYNSERDTYLHCVVACEIAQECSLATAIAASLGKEVKDLFDKSGSAELRDLMNDLSGIKCSNDERGCRDCCACEETKKYD